MFTDLTRVDRHAALAIVAILLATWVASRVLASAWRRYRGRLFPAALKSASLIATMSRIAVWSIGIMLALDQLGVSIAPLLTALGVGGLAVALALQPTLTNLFSGLQLLASRQMNPGDYISFTGGEGHIVDISWRNTLISDPSGALIVVPNQQLAQATVTQYTIGETLAYPIALAVPRDHDIAALESRLTATARAAGAKAAGLRLTSVSSDAMQCTLRVELPKSIEPLTVRDAVMREAAKREGAG